MSSRDPSYSTDGTVADKSIVKDDIEAFLKAWLPNWNEWQQPQHQE